MKNKSWFLEGLLTGAIISYTITTLISTNEPEPSKKSTKKTTTQKKQISRISNRILDVLELSLERVITSLDDQKKEKRTPK